MILLINKWNANAALANDAWIAKMNMNVDVSMEQIQQFITLWMLSRQVNLNEEVLGDIILTPTKSGP
jgi:hypothetical protein